MQEMNSIMIRNARTAAYVAVWNASQEEMPVSNAIPLAMKAIREMIGTMYATSDKNLFRAAVWDAIWAVADGDDWAADYFCIVGNISRGACMTMVDFNALEYIGCPGVLYAVARAAAWHKIAATRTYDAWVETYELCLREAREVLKEQDEKQR